MVQFYFYDELSSTMDEARSLVEKGTDEGSVVIAKRQTKGRGRRGRVWQSPPGNLFMTYITYLNCPLPSAPQLSFVACVGVGEAMRPLIPPGNTITYKWPNDVLLNGKKVSGILLETIDLTYKCENAYLIGCGLNITDQPSHVRYPATSLQDEGIFIPYDEVLHAIISSFQHYIDLWKKDGFSPIQDLWMMGSAHMDSLIKVDIQGNLQEGIFKGLDREGAMILETPQGFTTINVGEVMREEVHASCN